MPSLTLKANYIYFNRHQPKRPAAMERVEKEISSEMNPRIFLHMTEWSAFNALGDGVATGKELDHAASQ